MKNIEKYISYISSIIIFLASVTAIWFLLCNIQPMKSVLFLTPVLIIIVSISGIRVFFPQLWKKIPKVKEVIYKSEKSRTILFCLIVILIGLLLRFFIFFYFDYKPVSDPAQFLKNATSIAAGNGIANKFFLGFFPYLVAYSNLLSFAIKIISNSWLAIIILNSLFDTFSSLIIFKLIKQIAKPKSIAPFVGLVLWILSPFNILFSTLSLPIVVVNFFIIIGIYLVYIMSKWIIKQNVKKMIIYAIILGIVLGIANCFRPVFPVFLIALLLYLVYILLSTKGLVKRTVTLTGLSFVITVCLFFTISRLNVAFVSSQTGYNASSSASGWSTYVGSNKESYGGYNKMDADRLWTIVAEYNNDFPVAHKALTKLGLERYKSYGVIGTLDLFGDKLYKFASKQSYLTNINTSIVGYSNSKISKLFDIYFLIFTTTLFIASSYFFYIQSQIAISNRKELNPIAILFALLILGFFFSSMFFEVANRYAQIMYPLFVLTGAMAIDSKWSKDNKKFQ